MNKIDDWKTHKNASMLWNSDGAFKDDPNGVDVDNDDNIISIEDIISTIGKLNFSITYCLSLVLSTRSMTWCFVNDVAKDQNWSGNFTFGVIFTSFIIL